MVVLRHLETPCRWANSLAEGLWNWTINTQRTQCLGSYQLPCWSQDYKESFGFDVKTDGQKKAHLVAKGFSQVEGVDYNQIFSPVVHTVWDNAMHVCPRCTWRLAHIRTWCPIHLSIWQTGWRTLYGVPRRVSATQYERQGTQASTYMPYTASSKQD